MPDSHGEISIRRHRPMQTTQRAGGVKGGEAATRSVGTLDAAEHRD